MIEKMKKPFQDSLWMDCLLELYEQGKREGKETVEFADVDRLVIEKSKIPYNHQLFEPRDTRSEEIDGKLYEVAEIGKDKYAFGYWSSEPKPDEGRLLTDKECLDAEDEAAKYWDDNIDAIDIPGKYAYCRVAIAKKQRDLTASIKDNDNILLLQYAEEKYPELLTDADWVNIKQSRWSQWQLDKVKESVNVTAIIKDAECQERVDRIIHFAETNTEFIKYGWESDEWQALKKKELK